MIKLWNYYLWGLFTLQKSRRFENRKRFPKTFSKNVFRDTTLELRVTIL